MLRAVFGVMAVQAKGFQVVEAQRYGRVVYVGAVKIGFVVAYLRGPSAPLANIVLAGHIGRAGPLPGLRVVEGAVVIVLHTSGP